MTHAYYPVALDLQGKYCLVVGGGTIATDKVEGLLRAGARVTVVSPETTPKLATLAETGAVALLRRPYRAGDLDSIFLVYGATDDPAANTEVVEDARAAGILANAVDDIPNCDFFAMAIVRRGDLQVAISTNGRSPAFARWLREYLEATLPAEHEDLLAALGDVRDEIKPLGPIPAYEHWNAAISEETLVRPPSSTLNAARERIHAKLRAAQDSMAAETATGQAGRPATATRAGPTGLANPTGLGGQTGAAQGSE